MIARAHLPMGLAAVLVAGAVGCADPRPRAEDTCPTWQDDIAGRVLNACTDSGCHGASPAAGYDLRSYLGALGPGSDSVPNAIASDPTSALVTVLDPATATDPHLGQGALHTLLSRWVACDLAYFESPLHPGGILDPASADFHGKELDQRGWDFALCASCHGADFAGTTRAPACTSCHTSGPTTCDTCHPAEPRTGAHTSHLAIGVACSTCHRVPAVWNQEGHVLVNGQPDRAPAEVTLSGLAEAVLEPADRTGPPAYDPATGACAQVYCHGDVLGPTGAANPRPVWTQDPPGPAACSSCHGAPPTSHARARCAECHPLDRHINTTMDIGAGQPGCLGCHGSGTSAAPPRDLLGNTSTSALGVGAHRAHLDGGHRLAPPVPCDTCHVVPTTVLAVGHLDSADAAEVKAAVGWDRDARTCNNRCHLQARPDWTGTQVAFCGSCHGVPPATPVHANVHQLSQCTTCHSNTVDVFGNIKLTDGPGGVTSPHMDGDVDAP